MLENSNHQNLYIDFDDIYKLPKKSNEEDLNVPFPCQKAISFFEAFSFIFEKVKFEVPDEIFQFYMLIKEDRSQLTVNNISKINLIYFLLQLLSMETIPIVMISCLKMINTLIKASNSLFIALIQNNLLEFLPQIYTFPMPEVQYLISKIYARITKYDDFNLIEKCAHDFLDQSIFWAADHKLEKCRLKCLYFQYNVIIGSGKPLNMNIVSYLSQFLLTMLISQNIKIISLSAWSIRSLVQNYGLVLDLKDAFNCLFSSVNDQVLINTEAAVPVLRMLVKILAGKDKLPQSDLLPLINWPILFQRMKSSDNEISYLSCRVSRYLVTMGVETIEAAISNGILDVVCLIYQSFPYKSMREVSILLSNILSFGNIDQKKLILSNRALLLFLEIIGSSENEELFKCYFNVLLSLKSILEIEPLFAQQFAKNVPSYFFENLVNHSDDDVSNNSQIVFDQIYLQIENLQKDS